MSSRYLEMVRGQRRGRSAFQWTAKSLLACIAVVTATVLAEDRGAWSGRLLLVVQPAEEAVFTLITKQWGEYIVKRFIPFNKFIFG